MLPARASARFAVRMLAVLCLASAAPVAYAQTRVNTYLELKAKQQWAEALAVIRQEIATPALRTPIYLANVRVIAIGAIVDIANQSGLRVELDAEAERYYRQALQYASGDSEREAVVQKVYARYSAMVAQTRINTYTALKARQQWSKALEVIRQEIASPLLGTSTYFVDMRVIGIGALGDFSKYLGVQPAMDEEAARYYKEALRRVDGDAQREGQLHQTYARYFSDTKRNGLALPLFRETLEYWKKRNNQMMIFVSLESLAAAHSDMGEIGLRDYYREEGLKVAADYFSSGKATLSQWLQYQEALNHRMDNLATSGSVEAIDKLWPTLRDIAQRYLVRKAPTYRKVATYLAIAGEPGRATQMLAEAEQMWSRESPLTEEGVRKAVDSDFDMARGMVAFHAGRYPEANAALDNAFRVRTELGIALDDIAIYRYRGLVFEQLGELDRASESFQKGIDLAEKVRQSFTVAERVAFFRSTVQRSYLGQIRVSARQAVRDGGIDRFWEAVQASEMVRARQLGDLIDPKAPVLISRETLEGIRGSLGAERAGLYFTVADQSLVILGLAHDRQIAVVQPIDASFSDSLRRLARDLARPGSPVGRIESDLMQLSKTVLGPVAGLLQSRTELTVLPDGVLNLVPFDLLSADSGKYRPLMETHRVKLAPSLRFVGRTAASPRAGGLYALADPVYKKPDHLGGLDQADIQVATRGSRYLEYFQRLPETRTEVEAIKGMFAGAKVQTVYGEQATESALKRTNLTGFSFLHFATHGILGSEVPGIGEPALVLSAEPNEDGFLTASEISALKMDAQLAVLSACNTGSGEYVTGEGVLGLSRAFLIAGSRAVVVSLWPVESKATERLMVMFYANLRAGQDPHEALRNAKLRFVKEARDANSPEHHPMFWAPFVVFGA